MQDMGYAECSYRVMDHQNRFSPLAKSKELPAVA